MRLSTRVLLLLPCLAACDPTSVGNQQLTSFQYAAKVHGDTIPTTIEVVGFGRQIVFAGQTNTPTSCDVLEADLDADDFTLTLEITARQISTNCDTKIGAFTYVGDIGVRRSGTYHLIVRHVFNNSSWAPITITRDIEIGS